MKARCWSALAGLAILLAGCGPANRAPEQTGGWAVEAVRESRTASTEFGRRVLRDGVVTRAEYEQSVRTLQACGRAHGQVIAAEPRYGLYIFSAAGEAGNAVYRECIEGDLAAVQSVFYGQFTDPQNRGEIVVAECLIRHGVLPAGYRFREETFNVDLDRIARDGALTQTYERCQYNPLDQPEDSDSGRRG